MRRHQDLHRRVLDGHTRVRIGRRARRIRWQHLVGVLLLLVLHDHRAAVAHVVDQPSVVGDEIRIGLRRADADDDGVEAGEVAGREHVGTEHGHVDAHAANRLRHLIAAAHDVADFHRRNFHVEDLRGGGRWPVEPVRLDVWIRNHLHVARERLARNGRFRGDLEAPRGAPLRRCDDKRRGRLVAARVQRERRLRGR